MVGQHGFRKIRGETTQGLDGVVAEAIPCYELVFMKVLVFSRSQKKTRMKNIIFSMRKVISKNMFRFVFENFRDVTKDFLIIPCWAVSHKA